MCCFRSICRVWIHNSMVPDELDQQLVRHGRNHTLTQNMPKLLRATCMAQPTAFIHPLCIRHPSHEGDPKTFDSTSMSICGRVSPVQIFQARHGMPLESNHVLAKDSQCIEQLSGADTQILQQIHCDRFRWAINAWSLKLHGDPVNQYILHHVNHVCSCGIPSLKPDIHQFSLTSQKHKTWKIARDTEPPLQNGYGWLWL